ncbi:hypothetical protein [Ammoniphilus resinae]|uniref:Uncharacterized protein n=1 Tax=Ammoniphilus resinae TaxID=861532 RepID=A0ABS4GUM4_9BACL|nr:hypothetical protein [Ammoniphilus resinae]MBP1933956.1 hypothetical protein [Ammoniphilus resinae]
MNRDFIRIKALEGELKLSQIKTRYGCSITTKELIFQKPHHSYHIRLADIISIIPYELEPGKMVFSPQSNIEEKVTASFGSSYYKVTTETTRIYNRSGVFEKGRTDFIIPLSEKMLEHIAQYSNLIVVR